MRLINTSTLCLEWFFGEAVPYYAILSHRWNDVEVSLQDFQDGTGKNMVGYLKIQRCCAQAQSDGWQYVWIDSCCIDKTSSAEQVSQFFAQRLLFPLSCAESVRRLMIVLSSDSLFSVAQFLSAVMGVSDTLLNVCSKARLLNAMAK